MLVHWARSEGWLVFYVPKGRQWTHGGFFYRNQQTGLWDTPVQAASNLQYNNWFTFSEYEEPVTYCSTRPIHANELATADGINSQLFMSQCDHGCPLFTSATSISQLNSKHACSYINFRS